MAPTREDVSSPTSPLAVLTMTIAPERSQAGGIDGRAGLADDGASGPAAGEALDLRLHRVDDLDLQPPVEEVEVARPPGLDHGVGDEREYAAPKGGVDQHGRHVQDGVLAPPPRGVGGADGLVDLEEGEQGEAKGVLHARPPEAVELPPEDGQGVGDRLVPVPAEARVDQVEPEGALGLGHVQVDDVALAWPEAPARGRPAPGRGGDRPARGPSGAPPAVRRSIR